MATKDDSSIGGRKTRIRGDSSKDVILKSRDKLILEADKKKKKDK